MRGERNGGLKGMHVIMFKKQKDMIDANVYREELLRMLKMMPSAKPAEKNPILNAICCFHRVSMESMEERSV